MELWVIGLAGEIDTATEAVAPLPMQILTPLAGWCNGVQYLGDLVRAAWTTTQRRELLRLLFAGIAIKHVGYRNGPRVDPGRLVITWAR